MDGLPWPVSLHDTETSIRGSVMRYLVLHRGVALQYTRWISIHSNTVHISTSSNEVWHVPQHGWMDGSIYTHTSTATTDDHWVLTNHRLACSSINHTAATASVYAYKGGQLVQDEGFPMLLTRSWDDNYIHQCKTLKRVALTLPV